MKKTLLKRFDQTRFVEPDAFYWPGGRIISLAPTTRWPPTLKKNPCPADFSDRSGLLNKKRVFMKNIEIFGDLKKRIELAVRRQIEGRKKCGLDDRWMLNDLEHTLSV